MSNNVEADNMPIIDITQENLAEHWSDLLESINMSSFIAIDIVTII
jgi:hypothetical protein